MQEGITSVGGKWEVIGSVCNWQVRHTKLGTVLPHNGVYTWATSAHDVAELLNERYPNG